MWRRAATRGIETVACIGGSVAAVCTAAAAPGEGAEAYSWGYGQLGQLGHPGEVDHVVPKKVALLSKAKVTMLVSGPAAKSSAAVGADGKVYTFGCGRDGRLGHGSGLDAVNQDVPKAVAGIKGDAVAAACGEAHTLVLTADNRVWSFGKPRQGRLGRPCGAKEGGVPAVVAGLGGPEAAKLAGVSAGRAHSVAWDASGALFAWGAGHDGAPGLGSTADVAVPTRVGGSALAAATAAGATVVQASCGRDHTLVLLSNGAVLAMGADDSGQCGTGQAALRHLEPVQVRGLGGPDEGAPRVVRVLAGDQHSVAILEDGGAMAWGGNSSGQLATGDRSDVGIPRRIETTMLEGERVVGGAAGGNHTLLLLASGEVLAVGRGRNGQLGRGDTTESVAAYRLEPVKVESLSRSALGGSRSVTTVAAGSDHSLALVADSRA